jgi:hypothetical protein
MSRFEPFGPFDMPVDGVHIDTGLAKEFWQSVEDARQGLQDAIGCYIFAIRAGRGTKPWYVGKTERSFRQEAWQPGKLLLFSKHLDSRKRGTPVLYLIAKQTSRGRFAKGSRSVKPLEEMLIGQCLLRNHRLLNKKDINRFLKIEVPGFMNEPRGARSAPAKELAKLLGPS